MNRNYHNDHWPYMEHAEPPGRTDCKTWAELVQDHADNPRNFGDMSEGLADGYVSITDPECGDRIDLWLLIENGRIFDIRFKSNGCAATIAANSMMTTLALGRTIAEARQLTDQDIVMAFHGALEKQGECPLAGMQALHQALEQYEKKLTADS